MLRLWRVRAVILRSSLTQQGVIFNGRADHFFGASISTSGGRFRIICRLSARDVVEIVAIGPRRVIYGVTYEFIRKEKEGD